MQVLYQVEKPYAKAILTDTEALMATDINYNFVIDGKEILRAIDLWRNKFITTKQLLMLIEYWRNKTCFVKEIDYVTLYNELKNMSRDVNLFDEKYYLANPIATAWIVCKHVNSSEYSDIYYDCDDFTFLAMGILHANKMSAATATFYAIVEFKHNGVMYGHALLLMKALDGRWYYYDPLTNLVFEYNGTPFRLVNVFG